MSRARARSTDPQASHDAGARINLKVTQQAVMAVMRMQHEPVLDEELITAYEANAKALMLPVQSHSGLRSRRSELSKMDPPRLVAGAKKRMSTGGMGLTWVVTPSAQDRKTATEGDTDA